LGPDIISQRPGISELAVSSKLKRTFMTGELRMGPVVFCMPNSRGQPMGLHAIYRSGRCRVLFLVTGSESCNVALLMPGPGNRWE